MQVKVLFVVPSSEFEQIGILSISSVLGKNGFETDIVDGNYKSVRDKLKSEEGLVVLANYTLTIFYNKLLKLNRRIKQDFNVLSVFGGPHPTFFPDMIEEDGVDGVCRGEGEQAMLELVRNLQMKVSISNIKNWWVKENGSIHRNPVRPLVEDLDSLPFPDRRLSERITTFDKGRFYFMTTRGCPYDCTYCFNHAYDKLYNNTARKVRRRSVSSVIAELKQVRDRYNFKLAVFQDSIFILSMKWLKEFSYRYEKEINVPFWCYVRANIVTPEVIGLLKKAGCVLILMGVECGDDYYRNTVLKRNMSKSDIVEAARIIRKEKIRLITSNVLALPGADWGVDMETFRLNKICRPFYARSNILSPYPETEIHLLSIECGIISDGFESSYFGANWFLSRRFDNKKERLKLENFVTLFSVAVCFRFPVILLRVLIRIPITKFYKVLNLLVRETSYLLSLPSYGLFFYEKSKIVNWLKRRRPTRASFISQ